MHRLSWDDTWGLKLNSLSRVGLDSTLAINWVTEGIDDTAEKAIADGHINDRASSLDDIAFLDLSVW